MIFRIALALCVVVHIGLAEARAALGQTTAEAARWERILNDTEAYVRGSAHETPESNAAIALLDAVIKEAAESEAIARSEVEGAAGLLASLGEAPGEGMPPEAADVADRRRQIGAALTRWRAQQVQADYALTRARALQHQIGKLERQRRITVLTERWPPPLDLSMIAEQLPVLTARMATILASPIGWYRGLSADQHLWLWLHASILVVAVAIAMVARRLLLKRFEPDPEVSQPSYARRFAATIASAVGEGLLPAAMLGVIYVWSRSATGMITGVPADTIAALSVAAIFLALTVTLSRAILRPHLPAWQLALLTPESARRLSRRIAFLASVRAADYVMRHAGAEIAISDDARIVYGLLTVALQGLAMLLLTSGRVWRFHRQGEAAAEELAGVGWQGWRIVRIAFGLVTVIAMTAYAVGYLRLGYYLIDNLVGTAVIAGGLFLLRGLLREGVDLLTGEHAPALLKRMALFSFKTSRIIAAPLIDVILGVVGIFLVATGWGLPRDNVIRWLTATLAGFSVGGVTISFADLALALLAFSLGMVLTRIVRMTLAQRILPNTRLDTGIQNSIAVGVGYLGTVIALLVAVSVLGLGLSNLAIVAGALSVGIGFGLQNIVNNFVSGLILLVERPVRVGDWVVIGSNEGYVRRINVRATEIETFQRASVIVPNSELLSSALVNWTHTDTVGRVDVRIGVAYGSDTTKVREILFACAENHPEVIAWPRPLVLFIDFGASSLDFELRAHVRDVGKRLTVGSDLRFAIDKAFREAGIEIPFPQQVVHLADVDRLRQTPAAAPTPPPPAAAPPTLPSGETGRR
jgi:small-conductance mechanosensitive channel